MIYLDQLNHLLPDPVTMDIDELHRIAGEIGMRREWFQDNSPRRYPHYDILSKRKQARARRHPGVYCIDARAWVTFVRAGVSDMGEAE